MSDKKSYQIIIEGHIVKELRCKNDDCRALIGYENIMLGVFIFNCPKCEVQSVFKVQYKPKAKKILEDIQKMKGGEIENG